MNFVVESSISLVFFLKKIILVETIIFRFKTFINSVRPYMFRQFFWGCNVGKVKNMFYPWIRKSTLVLLLLARQIIVIECSVLIIKKCI